MAPTRTKTPTRLALGGDANIQDVYTGKREVVEMEGKMESLCRIRGGNEERMEPWTMTSPLHIGRRHDSSTQKITGDSGLFFPRQPQTVGRHQFIGVSPFIRRRVHPRWGLRP